MPWRNDFFRPLNREGADGERTRVRINTERGRLVDFVVQYETPNPDAAHGHFALVRYDGSHQPVHRDLLNAEGETIRKSWLAEHLSFDEALRLAILDIDQNWRRYRDDSYRRRR